ncbi:class I SAM-dependent methyltransferase [Fulvivirga ligni]|uniref:class I SAM-dependent methyltransferase n=1 Tax=Fulvivirga ligni TaxID=2904246 RepID=UPI001F359571|nr:class I SAM-dependent methyltransferase [Fulvivirga ligni]UII24103.1 class I SAM-dependent methyltransferase [Fulvivirga ligni]
MSKQKWDDRYEETGFAYGSAPNEFFKLWLEKLSPGKILMPADGEGRNGVFAAEKGWDVTSMDLSEEGKKKAMALAIDKQVPLQYIVGDLNDLSFEESSFDAIGLIYAHFPGPIKSKLHQKLNLYLKPGGIIIFEAFSKSHLPIVQQNPAVGGPRDLETLFSTEEIENDFCNYENLYLKEELNELSEGKYHNGTGSVVRFVGKKL